MFDVDNPTLAAISWSRLVEPGDVVAGALVASLGPSEALRWLQEFRDGKPSIVDGAADSEKAATRLLAAVEGWLPRLTGLDPERDVEAGVRVGASVLVPSDAMWPTQFRDLGPSAPFALWVRGSANLTGFANRSVAIVGSRAATHYGEHIAAEMGAGLAERGFGVISGGAYGIDAAAHRGALETGGLTAAFLACGIDRVYPPGNTALLRAVSESGALVTELPPGATPYRNRFLARNRLIAALARATVVVEAAWRSGALSTARHAATLLRPVGAVPGPVTSMASGGCHQLIRDGVATLVTDAGEVAELAGAAGTDAATEPLGQAGASDGLSPEHKRVFDVLPLRNYVSAADLTRNAALPLTTVLSGLGILEIRGLAKTNGTGWRRSNRVTAQ